MILKGKTNIRSFTVSDPHYDSSVQCRLSELLPKQYDWDVEIHLNESSEKSYGAETKLLDTSIFIERIDKETGISIFSKKTFEGFAYLPGLKQSTNFIGVDMATFMINDVKISTTSDGQYGGFFVLTNPKVFSEYKKGLVGIQCTIYFDDYCSCDKGWNLVDSKDVKKMFEYIFNTELKIIEKES